MKFKVGDKIIQRNESELPIDEPGKYMEELNGKIFTIKEILHCKAYVVMRCNNQECFDKMKLILQPKQSTFDKGICAIRFRKVNVWIKL